MNFFQDACVLSFALGIESHENKVSLRLRPLIP